MSMPRVSGSTLPLKVFGTPSLVVPHVSAQNPKENKRATTRALNVLVGGRWFAAIVANILDLYKQEWWPCNQGLLAKKHWIHIHMEHTRHMPNKLWRLRAHVKEKFEKMEVKYRR